MTTSSDRAALIAEFSELADLDELTSKEVYAHYGLLIFHFSLLEHSLINALMFERAIADVKRKIVSGQPSWSDALDRHFEHAKSLTFGNLVNSIVRYRDYSPFEGKLRAAKLSRDYFTHHFFRDEIAYFGSEEGRWLLLERMNSERKRVNLVEKELKPVAAARLKRVGLPQASDDALDSLVAVEYEEALRRVRDRTAVLGWEKLRDRNA